MDASPFKTFAEFSGATGNIAAFSQFPAFNIVMTLVGVGLTIWFIASSFRTKH